VSPRREPGGRTGALAAHRLRALGPLLAGAVLWADAGAAAFFLPGLVWLKAGAVAPAFVLAACAAFALLAGKYAEIAARLPRGGVVAAASAAFGPRAGALGGALVLADLLVAAALAASAGAAYLAALVPALDPHVPRLALGVLVALGIASWTGARGLGAGVAAIGLVALALLLVVAGLGAWRLAPEDWSELGAALGQARELPLAAAATGLGAAWLAFSGIESAAQLGPALAAPRARTARRAALWTALALLATAPLLTALASVRLDPAQLERPDALVAELARIAGGRPLRLAVSLAGAALLFAAAHVALLGICNAAGALGERGFLPRWLVRRSRRFGTPAATLAVAVLATGALVWLSRAQLAVLAGVFGFGALGAFTLASLALDRIRIRERRIGPRFALGLVTSALVALAWGAAAAVRPRAVVWGGGVALALLAWGFAARRRRAPAAGEAERDAARPGPAQILTLPEALELRPAYTPKTVLCLRGPNERLLEEGLVHLRGQKEWEAALVFVDEVPASFLPRESEPGPDAREVLAEATVWLGERGVTALPIWRQAHDAGEAIADAARQLGAETVLVGASQRGALWRVLRGSVLARLVARAPARTRIVVVS
jgi:amino acid transporter/nucleotide-binding universal stress UspA family protein